MPKGYPETLTHGIAAYSSRRCLCDVCHDAYMAWRRKKYGIRPMEQYRAEIEPAHGTESRYNHHRCTCAECREAARAARARRRKAAAA